MRSALERSRYAQIALTYTRPWPMRIGVGITSIFLAWCMIAERRNTPVQFVMLTTGGSFAAWLGAMVAAHAKEQLADARSSLIPNFRRPHLLVAAAMFLLMTVGTAMLIVWLAQAPEQTAMRWNTALTWPEPWDDIWPVGYLALVLLVTAMLAWMGQIQAPGMVVVVIAMFVPATFAEGRNWLTGIIRGRDIATACGLLALALGLLAALWWRLGVMHEEMAEYNRLMSPGFRLKVRMTGDPVFRRENRADTGRAEEILRGAMRLDRMRNVFAAPFRSRIDHWRIVIGMGRMPQLVAVVLTLMMASHLLWTRAEKQMAVVLPMILSTIVPGLIVGATWPRRWYVLADESLRPQSRPAFIREQGAAMAAEYRSVWGWITLLTCGLGLLIGDWRDTLPKMLLALPLIASGQLLTFGVIVWVMRYRAGWLVIVPMLLSLLIAIPLMIADGMIIERKSVFLSVSGTALLLVVGAAVTFDAYRRWLVTEFD